MSSQLTANKSPMLRAEHSVERPLQRPHTWTPGRGSRFFVEMQSVRKSQERSQLRVGDLERHDALRRALGNRVLRTSRRAPARSAV